MEANVVKTSTNWFLSLTKCTNLTSLNFLASLVRYSWYNFNFSYLVCHSPFTWHIINMELYTSSFLTFISKADFKPYMHTSYSSVLLLHSNITWWRLGTTFYLELLLFLLIYFHKKILIVIIIIIVVNHHYLKGREIYKQMEWLPPVASWWTLRQGLDVWGKIEVAA